MHLYGSHFNYKDRYTDEFACFLPDKAEYISVKNKRELINSYNNSIISTADLVAKVIRRIEAQDAESSLLYLSDHGEDLMDDSRNIPKSVEKGFIVKEKDIKTGKSRYDFQYTSICRHHCRWNCSKDTGKQDFPIYTEEHR